MKTEIENLYHKLKGLFEKYTIYLIIIFAFIIRFQGIGRGLPYLYHPDEHYANDAIRIIATGDLNPHWFGHPGSFVIYLLAILFAFILGIYFIYSFLSGQVYNLTDFKQLVKNSPIFYDGENPVLFYFCGRLTIIFFAIVTVYLIYLIAKKHFNKSIGLLAAFCLAISPLHIEYSRVIRTDICAILLIIFSIYFLMEFFIHNKDTKLLILSSLFAGFSIAARYISGIIIIPILIYCLTTDFNQRKLLSTKYLVDFFRIKTNLSRALLFVFIGFFIFAPFVILDFNQAVRNIQFELRDTHLGHERLPGIQNHIWYLKNALQKGMGGAFFASFAGLGLCLLLFRKSYKKYLFLIFPLLYYAVIVEWGNLRWERWLIPVLPFEAILFGVGFYFSYKFLTQRKLFLNFKLMIYSLFAIMIILSSIPTIIYDIKQGFKLSKIDTRTIAKNWI